MITRQQPSDWKDLQRQVATVFEECGFDVGTEEKVRSVRAEIEFDVLATEDLNGREYKFVCECKYWKRNIPQEVVHAFRTATADVGANVGYIIAKAGFQKGSFSAADLTNIRLTTWPQFQLEFLDTWYRNYFVHEVDRRFSPLMTYSEPLVPSWYSLLSPSDQWSYRQLNRKYSVFGMLLQDFGPYSQILRAKRISLPARLRLPKPEDGIQGIPEEVLDETAYRDFLQLCTPIADRAIREFRALRTRALALRQDDRGA
jgi:restriction system protein